MCGRWSIEYGMEMLMLLPSTWVVRSTGAAECRPTLNTNYTLTGLGLAVITYLYPEQSQQIQALTLSFHTHTTSQSALLPTLGRKMASHSSPPGAYTGNILVPLLSQEIKSRIMNIYILYFIVFLFFGRQ